jgi:hypothetical protein
MYYICLHAVPVYPDMVVKSSRWSWEVQILSLESVENYPLPHFPPLDKETPNDKASDTSEEGLR